MPKFSYLIAFKKGLKSLLELGVAVFVSMVPQLVDHMFTLVDSAHEVVALGVPVAWVPVVLIAVRMLSNRWKNRRLAAR